MRKSELINLKQLITKYQQNPQLLTDKEYELLCENGFYYGAGKHYWNDGAKYQKGLEKFGLWDITNAEMTPFLVKQLNRYINLTIKQNDIRDLQKIELPIFADPFYEVKDNETYAEISQSVLRNERSVLHDYALLNFTKPVFTYPEQSRCVKSYFGIGDLNLIVKYSEFISLLQKDEFSLEGLETFDIVEEKWRRGEEPSSSLVLDFKASNKR